MRTPRILGSFLAAVILVVTLVGGPGISAQEGAGCAEGFVPAQDGNGCVSETEGAFNDNITTTTSCTQGVLSADGTQCLIPRLDAPAVPDAPAATSATTAVPAQAFTG